MIKTRHKKGAVKSVDLTAPIGCDEITANEDHKIPLVEGELAKIIEGVGCGVHVDVAFGVSGCALQWKKGEKMPVAVRLLGMMRGVLNENCDGGGI